jgi:hypothetical protein
MRKEEVRHPANAGFFRFASGAWCALACVALALVLGTSSGCAKKPTAADAPAAQAAAPSAPEASADAANAVGAPMPCAELTTARYPFLTCVRGEGGGPVLATVGAGEVGERLNIPSKFVSGDGYWGPSGLE